MFTLEMINLPLVPSMIVAWAVVPSSTVRGAHWRFFVGRSIQQNGYVVLTDYENHICHTSPLNWGPGYETSDIKDALDEFQGLIQTVLKDDTDMLAAFQG